MLYIRFDKAEEQSRTKYSAFISFKYDPYYVEEIKKLPIRVWRGGRKEWEIPTIFIPQLYKIDNDITFLNDPPEDILSNREVVLNEYDFKTTPLKHQMEGVLYGINNCEWLLGDEQGLGKSKQMIDLAVWKKNHQGLKHCLIICGVNNLKYNWVEEIQKHSNESCRILGFTKPNKEPSMKDRLAQLASCPEEFFWITNIESLRCHKEGRFYKSEIVEFINAFIRSGELGLVVVDEIHKAKNPTSAQGRGLLQIKGCCKVGLSGTLLVNKPLDLYVPLRFIDATGLSFWQFKQRYVVEDMWGAPKGWKNMDELQNCMNTYMLRRTKALLDLPPKLYKEEYLEMSTEERRLYEHVKEETAKEIRADLDKINTPAMVLAKLIRMRQICCHTGLVSTQVVKSTKFERLRDILDEAKDNNEKVIVFTSFRELVKLALEEFKDYNPYHIWGQMTQEEIAEQKNGFQDNDGFQVLFGVIQAAGTGLTLNTASIVVFLDLPWNKATMVQAEDRAHRIGTKNTVQVISLLMKDSYDEYLHKLIISKQNISQALIDNQDIRTCRKFIKEVFKLKEEVE